MNKLKCQICEKECKTSSGFGLHIKLHNITSEEYYYKYLYTGNEPMCKLCSNKTKFENFSKGYRIYCSVKCTANDKELQDKKNQTKLNRYGSLQNTEKIKQTCLKRYGVDSPMKVPEIKQKSIQTCLDRYGVDNPSKSDYVKAKKENTLLKNYGVSNPSKSDVIQRKKIATFNRRYGVDNPSKNTNIIKDIRIKAIKRKQEQNNGFHPNYNSEACKLIDEYGKQNGYNFQHAENGGEYHIKELGYWVDGYDKDKNVIIEVDEKHHFNSAGELKEKDIQRQKELEEHLRCKFIRIKT
jgi:hypothetical protein